MTSIIGDILVVEEFNAQTLTSAKFNAICRCCLSEGQMYPIFEMDFKGSMFKDLLKLCSSIQIEKNDSLPQNVCAICVKKVVELHSFKEQSSTSEAILKDVLRKEYLENLSPVSTNETNIVKNEATSIDESDCEEIILEVQNMESDIVETNDDSSDDTHAENDIFEESDGLHIESDILDANENNRMGSDNIETIKNAYMESDISEKNEENVTSVQKNYRISYSLQIPEEKSKLCEVCGKVVINLHQHMRIHTGLKNYECDICFKRFYIMGQLTQHMIIHAHERPLNENDNVRMRKITQSEKRPYKCEICPRAFFSLFSLKSHIDKHLGETNYVCSYCNERFTGYCTLHRHINLIHLGIPSSNDSNNSASNKCHLCEKILPSEYALYDHLQEHKDKKFLCSTCGKTCSNLTALQTHELIHSNVKRHTCTICGRSFRLALTLKMHFMRHTGEKPFACEVCGKRFIQCGQRKVHMRIHTGIRPYKCKVCEKSFSMKGNLDVHFRIHTGETPFVCDVCGKGFYHMTGMKKHRQTHREKIFSLLK